MKETAALRNLQPSKEHVEKEEATAEMFRTIQRHQENLLEATSNAAKVQQQKSTDETSHLVQ